LKASSLWGVGLGFEQSNILRYYTSIMRIHWLETATSSMDALKRFAEEGAPAGEVVFCEQQTYGRGQKGRNWFANQDSIAMSVLYRPEALTELARPEEWSVRIGQVVAAVLRQYIEQPVRVEWPNDLIIDQEKVGGILIETQTRGQAAYMIVGVGVNLNNRRFPEYLRHSATSLYLKSGKRFDKRKVGMRLVEALRVVEPSFPFDYAHFDSASQRDHFSRRDHFVGGRDHRSGTAGTALG
jgi:BirA family biotin operon repressor/biotin-[acetyl-CoA-carboxylase] ligase